MVTRSSSTTPAASSARTSVPLPATITLAPFAVALPAAATGSDPSAATGPQLRPEGSEVTTSFGMALVRRAIGVESPWLGHHVANSS
jgi:hypothetical protein